jgi:hypothetical protein
VEGQGVGVFQGFKQRAIERTANIVIQLYLTTGV